jgi:uncharacterized protein (TIGR00369 family)
MTPDGASAVAAQQDQALVALANAHRGELVERMGIVVTEATADRVVATMPVDGNRQPFGLLHGGASVVLAETAGSLCASFTAGLDTATVGIEINATHHRAVFSGQVTAVATRIHSGQRLATFDIRIVDDAERPVCSCRLTCMLGGKRPD